LILIVFVLPNASDPLEIDGASAGGASQREKGIIGAAEVQVLRPESERPVTCKVPCWIDRAGERIVTTRRVAILVPYCRIAERQIARRPFRRSARWN